MTWNDSGDGCFLKNPDSRGTLVRPWLRRCRHSQTSFRGQARMSENTGLGILAHCTSRGRRGTLEPVMRYFVAGAGLGRFRSLIPCACHATDSQQHTVNTTEVGNTIRVGSKTAVKCATTAVVPDIMHVIVDQKLCAEVEQHKLDGINNFDSGHRLVNSLYISHNTAC